MTANVYCYIFCVQLGGNVRTNDGSCKLSLDADTGLLTYNATEALAIVSPLNEIIYNVINNVFN